MQNISPKKLKNIVFILSIAFLSLLLNIFLSKYMDHKEMEIIEKNKIYNTAFDHLVKNQLDSAQYYFYLIDSTHALKLKVFIENLNASKISDSLNQVASISQLIVNKTSVPHKNILKDTATKNRLIDLTMERNSPSQDYSFLNITNKKGITIKYLGSIRNNKANGYGYGIFDAKGTYEGLWENNLREGNGIYSWTNGDQYEGHFTKDQRNGKGTYTFNTGEVYQGEWKNDLRHGNGQLYDKKGKLIYDGIWKKDKPKGKKQVN